MNYSELVVNIADWLNRDDLERVIPSFISFGQTYIEDELLKRDIMVPDMESTPSYTPFLAKDTRDIDVPSDYHELKYLAFTDQLPSPINAAFTAAAGTLAAGTYYYRVTALNDKGETLGSEETTITLAVQGGVNVNWGKVDGATGYKIYGRSTGAGQLIATVGDVSTYLDNGSVTPTGALPSENTTGTIRHNAVDRYDNKKHADISKVISKDSKSRPSVLARRGNKFVFDRYADVDYAYDIVYYAREAKLSEATQTNYFTDKAEKALLYAAIMEAAPYLGDDPRVKTWEASRAESLENLISTVKREMSSGQRQAWGPKNIFFRK